MKKILITGGTGTIGKKLSQNLSRLGYEVVVLSRNPNSTTKNQLFWDYENKKMDSDALKNTYALIHLAGTNIGEKRWTEARKKELIGSRVDSLQFLYKEFEKINQFPEILISSSAVGYYGAVTSNKIFTEENAAAKDFLGQLCEKWENAALHFQEKVKKLVIIRTGVVLSNEKSGALQKMLFPFKLGLGSAIGSGKQYLPWIHIDDIVQQYIFALENGELNGIYNAVAPEHITNFSFSKKLAKTLKKPFFLPAIPTFMLKMIFGEMHQIITEGSRISTKKMESTGYSFRFPTLEKALKNLLINE